MKSVLYLALLVAAAVGYRTPEQRPLVRLHQGLLRGVKSTSAAGAVYYSFKGIPYAKPPLGPLRFQPPLPHSGWEGVLDASEHGSICVQFRSRLNNTADGSEDCLFANVYMPHSATRPGKKLPVMVFIHGGSFTSGDGDEFLRGPKYFMDNGVVLVTFNYRLGPFGFFTTHDSNAPGNYGLLDQVSLLKWVQGNIASFGGDRDKVTIFGVSAGGSSVSLQVMSPLSKGLFHRAISQSGAGISNSAASGRNQGSAQAFAKLLNCPTHDNAALVECVRSVSADELSNVVGVLGLDPIFFTPRVDAEASHPFLPRDPRKILESGAFNLVPWMHGLTEEEGAFFLPSIFANKNLTRGLLARDPTQWGVLEDLTRPAVSRILDCNANSQEVVGKVIDFHVGQGPFGLENPLPIARAVGDRYITVPVSEEIRLASAHTPVYKYVFNYRGPGRLTFAGLFGLEAPDLGVTHTEDRLYLFNNDLSAIPSRDSPTYTMICFMVDLWTNFARTGRPTSQVLDLPNWPAYSERTQRHMNLNLQPSLGQRLFEKRIQFWQSLPVNEPWRHPVDNSPCRDTPQPAELQDRGEGGY